jgi:chromosome segregation ATPase
LGDLRSIRNSIFLYSNVLSILKSSPEEIDAISGLLVNDFEELGELQNELDQAVGELTSKNSVMEGYSDTADDIRDRIAQNEREVAQLREHYRWGNHGNTCRAHAQLTLQI